MRAGWWHGAAAGLALLASGCGGFSAAPAPRPAALPPLSAKMQGMTEAGYTPGVFAGAQVRDAIMHLHQDGVNWLSIQVAWFQNTNASTVIKPSPQKTPTDGSVNRLIALAHHEGMRVFLDPFVNSMQGSGWQALFHPSDPTAWFRSFDTYVIHYAKLAQADHVDLLAIGDEFDSMDTVPAYRADWVHAIQLARRWYHGPITYGADYTTYQHVTFWKQLDDVAIDAYFPLSEAANPTASQLEAGWNRAANQVEAWRIQAGLSQKPLVITELGYPSENGAAAMPGAWYPNQPANPALQQRLYQATFQTLWQRPWVKGIMWFWWANPSNPHWQGGVDDNGYTLRGKPAENTLRAYFIRKSGGSVLKHPASRHSGTTG